MLTVSTAELDQPKTGNQHRHNDDQRTHDKIQHERCAVSKKPVSEHELACELDCQMGRGNCSAKQHRVPTQIRQRVGRDADTQHALTKTILRIGQVNGATSVKRGPVTVTNTTLAESWRPYTEDVLAVRICLWRGSGSVR